MDCMVCGRDTRRRAKVFINGNDLYVCRDCLLMLRVRELEYCERCGTYRFKREPKRATQRKKPEL